MQYDFGYSEEQDQGRQYDIRLVRRMFPFLKPHRGFIAFSVVLVLFITFLELAIPYLTKIVIDTHVVPRESVKDEGRYIVFDVDKPEFASLIKKYQKIITVEGKEGKISLDDLHKMARPDIALIRSSDLSGIFKVSVILLLLVSLIFFLSFVQLYTIQVTGERIMHDFRVRLFSHLLSLSMNFYTKNPVGRLVTRTTNDVQNMNELFNSVLAFVFKDVILLTGIAAVMLSIHAKLALVSFLLIPLVIIVSFRLSGLSRDAFRKLRIALARINVRLAETIEGMAVIQIFSRENDNFSVFREMNDEYHQAGMKQVEVFSVFLPIIEFLSTTSVALIIFYGGIKVMDRSLSLGDLVAFISYISMFFRPIRDLADKYNIMQNALASLERIFLVLDTNDKLPEVPENRWDFKNEKVSEICFDHVTFGYKSDEPVLSDVSFTLKRGEKIAFVGPTGSGKTTVMNLMLRLYDPWQGEIRLNGKRISEVPSRYLGEKIAVVPQDPFLFSGSIHDNIFRDIPLSEEDKERIIKISNLKPIIERLPDGVYSRIGEIGLSSGERQLISIARAFAFDPDIIILDEATSYIDSDTEQKIEEAVMRLSKNRTALIIAHRLSTVKYVNAIHVIRKGVIIERGNHEELMERKGFYYELARHMF